MNNLTQLLFKFGFFYYSPPVLILLLNEPQIFKSFKLEVEIM